MTITRRNLFGFLAVAPAALPAAVTALKPGNGGEVYLDGERVGQIIAERLRAMPTLALRPLPPRSDDMILDWTFDDASGQFIKRAEPAA